MVCSACAIRERIVEFLTTFADKRLRASAESHLQSITELVLYAAMPVKPEFKVTLLGAGGVGKSALTLRVISGVFTPTYNPTVEDYYRHDTNIDGVGQCIVEILDTAGTEQFASMRQLYISNCSAFALVYAVDDRASFDEVMELYQQITEVKSPSEMTVILVGNKCDLRSRREVEVSEGETAAKEMNNCAFLETSAKDGSNTHEFFQILVSAMDRRVKGNGVVKRPRSTSVSKLARRSLRIGIVHGRRERSRSQPDLSTYSTDSGSVSYPVAPVEARESSRKRTNCVIM